MIFDLEWLIVSGTYILIFDLEWLIVSGTYILIFGLEWLIVSGTYILIFDLEWLIVSGTYILIFDLEWLIVSGTYILIFDLEWLIVSGTYYFKHQNFTGVYFIVGQNQRPQLMLKNPSVKVLQRVRKRKRLLNVGVKQTLTSPPSTGRYKN